MAIDPIPAVGRSPDGVLEVIDALELARLARQLAAVAAAQSAAVEDLPQQEPETPVATQPEQPEAALQLSTLAFAVSRGASADEVARLARQHGLDPAAVETLRTAVAEDATPAASAMPDAEAGTDPLHAALQQQRLNQAATTVQPFMVYGVAVNGSNPLTTPVGLSVESVEQVHATAATQASDSVTEAPVDQQRLRDQGRRR